MNQIEIEKPGLDMNHSVNPNRENKKLLPQKFGLFNGVIRPTLLTILGVMMYLREGWVVGNAGLGGAILIILMAYLITGTTALSLSSITTNIRLGAGGVFALATQSLGVEVGGSIGIPFYLAQTLSVAMYIYGFMEGWLYIFPTHPPYLIVFSVFAIIFFLSYISAGLAFRVQVFVMLGVIVALVSIFGGLYQIESIQVPDLIGHFPQASFWTLFAVFFPAATGIMVGASMSGSLKDPRRSIPIGTMIAWGISLIVYLSLAVWYSLVGAPDELVNNLTIAIDKALWGPGVLIGILSSCFTAALSSFVASPRTLQSLGQHGILPGSGFLKKLNNDEPRNATLFTGSLVIAVLLLGDLNTIAQIVTVFFLMTYFTVNFILLIEQILNLISFRPVFHIPIVVPLVGSLACLSAIIIVSPFLGLICVIISGIIYVYLDRRSLDTPYETISSGLLVSIADWAATKVAMKRHIQHIRSWRPDIIALVERTSQLVGNYRLLMGLVFPQGSIQVIGLHKAGMGHFLNRLNETVHEIQEEGIFATSAIIDSQNYMDSLKTTLTVMRSSFFRPNILFMPIEERTQEDLDEIMSIARQNQLGILFIAKHKDMGLGKSRRVNLWIREQSPHWQLSLKMSNIDLPLLLTLMLMHNWKIRLRLITLVNDDNEIERARTFLKELMISARMPNLYEIVVEKAEFSEYIQQTPLADLNIFGLGNTINKSFVEKMVITMESTCIFVKDSGFESVLA